MNLRAQSLTSFTGARRSAAPVAASTDYGACLEINVEGDRNATFGLDAHPTPAHHEGWWDDYGQAFGYPYRGQPSVVYCAAFMAGAPAKHASAEAAELLVPTTAAPGELVEVALGGLVAQTLYYVAVRAVDDCAAGAPIATADVTTTKRRFTTVTPCFVATAGWGSPLAPQIGSLRRFRDRDLLSHAPGRLLASLYERLGPFFADFVRPSDTRRAAARLLLRPLIALVQATDTDH